MSAPILDELREAVKARLPCALVTVAATEGSVPREPGSKMLVYAGGRASGTIGGGKFESLVIEEAAAAILSGKVVLKSYPLRETEPDSFGAICGGTMTVLIEPHIPALRLCIIGAGHCSRAVAALAATCGFDVCVVDDRDELAQDFAPGQFLSTDLAAPDYIRGQEWSSDDILVLVSRNYQIDRDSLEAALQSGNPAYIGMIGSRRKVLRVFDELRARGITPGQLARVYAPIGLNIGADSPEEIAISILAEILAVLRGRSAGHLKL